MDGVQNAQTVVESILLDGWTYLSMGAIYFILRAAVRVSQSTDNQTVIAWFRRILPILPEVLGITFALVGGVPAVANYPFIMKIAAGLWVSWGASKFHKILGQTVLGDDSKIEQAISTQIDKMVSKPEDGSGPKA